MPYYKRSSYRYRKKPIKKYRKKRTFYKRRYRRNLYKIGRFMNVEFKQHNVDGSYNLQDNLQTQQLCLIAQGTNDNQRIGNSIKITSIMIRGFVTFNQTATASMCRMILVWDKQANEAALTAGDLLESEDVSSNLNIDNGKRFTVLWDKYFTLYAEKPIIAIKYYRKLNHKIRYDNAAAAITSITEGNLCLVRISNESVNYPVASLDMRLRYVDN